MRFLDGILRRNNTAVGNPLADLRVGHVDFPMEILGGDVALKIRLETLRAELFDKVKTEFQTGGNLASAIICGTTTGYLTLANDIANSGAESKFKKNYQAREGRLWNVDGRVQLPSLQESDRAAIMDALINPAKAIEAKGNSRNS